MGVGSLLILFFSDPTVTVMQDIADRIGISSFYVSFALAPLASNFVEVLAAYNFAKKKTRSSITVSLTNLLGAVILNNTFVLAIFMILMLMRGLQWTFTIETAAILAVQLLVGISTQKKVYTLLDGGLIYFCTPYLFYLFI